MNTDSQKPALSRQSTEAALAQLSRLAQLAEAIARRNIDRVRILLGVGLTAAAWLSYEVWQAFSPSAFILVPLWCFR